MDQFRRRIVRNTKAIMANREQPETTAPATAAIDPFKPGTRQLRPGFKYAQGGAIIQVSTGETVRTQLD
ncbi:hypothetical protein HMF8227_01465 [Saliniradius amylolyticus]|uniref:Uncharacterized protein n=1 Tax=Saliniradius amylolyticus TaxID=2183582 RepID=A0A2S2E3W0_9ALTE|nr:hypothetical protein [Saliniradius amylolyticus]AWL11940.1 hypothetical protein HMF8227_01465 [Saliniradius amylolyticus]